MMKNLKDIYQIFIKIMYIYILKCENDKYYIGKTKNYQYRFEQHKNGNGSEWTRLHKPYKILKIIPCHDCFDEDKYTKIYMLKYGIDNVRGGSYTQEIISDSCREFIEKEFITAQDLCYICKKKGHFANNCPIRYKNNFSAPETVKSAKFNWIRIYIIILLCLTFLSMYLVSF